MTTDPPIAYAGEPGAFAEDAVIAAYGDVPRVSLGSFREVFETVASGDATAGVVPIENVINGSVRENYDLLLEHDLTIRAEVVVPVRLCLAALPGQRLDEIERVYSHIQALGQAEGFLRRRPWQLLTTYNTAGAGKSIIVSPATALNPAFLASECPEAAIPATIAAERAAAATMPTTSHERLLIESLPFRAIDRPPRSRQVEYTPVDIGFAMIEHPGG